jgi:hypothetical protein
MRKETYAWLIGMTDVSDAALLRSAGSFAQPALLELNGAKPGVEEYAPERRAFCLIATNDTIAIKIRPVKWCVNPVFEFKEAPRKLLKVKLGNQVLRPGQYAWDGTTLWVEATINHPSMLELNFGD